MEFSKRETCEGRKVVREINTFRNLFTFFLSIDTSVLRWNLWSFQPTPFFQLLLLKLFFPSPSLTFNFHHHLFACNCVYTELLLCTELPMCASVRVYCYWNRSNSLVATPLRTMAARPPTLLSVYQGELGLHRPFVHPLQNVEPQSCAGRAEITMTSVTSWGSWLCHVYKMSFSPLSSFCPFFCDAPWALEGLTQLFT